MDHIRRPRSLLLAFDAFGTLFTPRLSIPVQYGEVARKHGLTGFTTEDIRASFGRAFKEESKARPNYGKETDMKAPAWWANVITKTFRPLIPQDSVVSPAMTDELLTRFSTRDGYRIYPDVLPFFQHLRQARRVPSQSHWDQIVVGIVTNSDDRIPGILQSLGLTVGPRRAGTAAQGQDAQSADEDITFVVLSYDVGVEKPDRRIFQAAEQLFRECLSSESAPSAAQMDKNYVKVFVGDDLEKDAIGALDAGWNGILVDREGRYEQEFKNEPVIRIVVPEGIDRAVDGIQTLDTLRTLISRES